MGDRECWKVVQEMRRPTTKAENEPTRQLIAKPMPTRRSGGSYRLFVMGYQGGSALQGCFPIFAQPHFLRLDPLRRHRPNPGRLLHPADVGKGGPSGSALARRHPLRV